LSMKGMKDAESKPEPRRNNNNNRNRNTGKTDNRPSSLNPFQAKLEELKKKFK